MKLTGRVSLEELDAYTHYMGFDSWASYKLTLSDYEINLLIITIYETRKEQADNIDKFLENEAENLRELD